MLIQGLQGMATGVLVINGTGQPGTEPTIRVRGYLGRFG